jgi:hypothetical protein
MHLSMHRSRRELLRLLAGSTALPGFAGAAGQPPIWDTVTARELRFPADHGAHPGFRTEWWYITGWIERGDGPPLWFPMDRVRARTATVMGRTIGGRPRPAGGCASLISQCDGSRRCDADSHRQTTRTARDRVHVNPLYCAAR